jgi:hypothetical protein
MCTNHESEQTNPDYEPFLVRNDDGYPIRAEGRIDSGPTAEATLRITSDQARQMFAAHQRGARIALELPGLQVVIAPFQGGGECAYLRILDPPTEPPTLSPAAEAFAAANGLNYSDVVGALASVPAHLRPARLRDGETGHVHTIELSEHSQPPPNEACEQHRLYDSPDGVRLINGLKPPTTAPIVCDEKGGDWFVLLTPAEARFQGLADPQLTTGEAEADCEKPQPDPAIEIVQAESEHNQDATAWFQQLMSSD